MKLKTFLISALCLSLAGGVSSPATANGSGPPAATKIVACTDDNRGVDVCYNAASIQRGATTLAVETDFELFFQDESDPAVFGDGGAGFVVRVEFYGVQNVLPEGGPNADDIADFRIIYPRTQADPFAYSGTGSALRGEDLATAAFAVTNAADFSFTKELKTMNSRNVIEFVIEKTYVSTWFRQACTFLFEVDENGIEISGTDPETGFSFPTEECETPNSDAGNEPNDSDSYVTNYVSFYTPRTFDFVTAANDGGYLNYQGTGLSWFVDEANEFQGGAFQFQLVGPKFAGGTDRNIGAVQAFIPATFMAQIFGNDFSPAGTTLQAQRVDAEQGSRTVQDLVSSNAVVTSVRSGGILIELPSYGFSAPGFSFSSSTNREPIAAPNDAPATSPATAAAPAPVLAKTGTAGDWGTLVLVGSLFIVLGTLMVAQSGRGRSKRTA